MATQAQLDEKLRQDRLGASSPNVEAAATPAQLAEKAQQSSSAFTSEYATPAQLAEKSRRNGPPPLPPRTNSARPPPPAYDANDERRSRLISEQWRSNDPRSSSTHSLVPSESQRDGRRKLLLIYIHGFMGNELSFQSFPAHVHNLVSIALAETHVVHTKLYPRYKSRNSIEFARDVFSVWLEPHEDHFSDIILLGHSMGGILGAEVALKRPSSPATTKPFEHRILGTIGFDTPFLGMHPGVVISGIGSLFRPAPEPPSAKLRQPSTSGTITRVDSQASVSSPSYAPSTVDSIESSQASLMPSLTSPLATPPSNDPYFDAPFTNDVHIPERKGLSNLLHFINKHSDGLANATKSYFMSHIEFGSCLADYPGLESRYKMLRALEDVDELSERPGSPRARRIRFLNYYTASTGRPKAPKHIKAVETIAESQSIDGQIQDLSLNSPESHTPEDDAKVLVNQHEDGAKTPKLSDQPSDVLPIEENMPNLGESSGIQYDSDEQPPMRHVDSVPIEEDDERQSFATARSAELEEIVEIQPTNSELLLPPIPEMPTEPQPIDLDVYTDKDSRKIAEKEQKRVMKAYQQAVKDRESAIKDRKKLIEKREKKEKQEADKKMKAEEKLRSKEEKEKEKARLQEEKELKELKLKASINPEEPRTRQGSATPSVKDDKPKRDKKFCMLPPTIRGQIDKCWVRIYMEGVDEVGAHCGLFWQGPQYESFVGDLGARIEQWVKDDRERRAILDNERV